LGNETNELIKCDMDMETDIVVLINRKSNLLTG